VSVDCFFQKLYDVVFVLIYKHAQVSVVFGNRNLAFFNDTAQCRSESETLMSSSDTRIANVVPFGEQSCGEASTAIPALLKSLTDAAVRAVARYTTICAPIHAAEVPQTVGGPLICADLSVEFRCVRIQQIVSYISYDTR
jgi:hypothetical protein